MSVVNTALLGGQGLLAIVLAGTGVAKLIGHEAQVEMFEQFGYPQWFRVVTGILELFAALGLLVTFIVAASLGVAGGILAIVILSGAVGTHLRAADPLSVVAGPAVLLMVALAVTLAHLGIIG